MTGAHTRSIPGVGRADWRRSHLLGDMLTPTSVNPWANGQIRPDNVAKAANRIADMASWGSGVGVSYPGKYRGSNPRFSYQWEDLYPSATGRGRCDGFAPVAGLASPSEID